ncbi:hypothetical protein [Neolewinella antarctica]|uniref:Uncharacterized protein n=1 Tax=Neolewinella antarctica TaxID=442734 RepID=A0ABX0X685_9BACT|nr:hypothetical protein [Neolewinella antarctica]NJC24729.1 hypothetical protein [Neolewinella antarctica]
MTYLTEKNDRRHRRNARMLTALITLSMFLAFAYFAGALDGVILDYMGPAETVVVAGPVASI